MKIRILLFSWVILCGKQVMSQNSLSLMPFPQKLEQFQGTIAISKNSTVKYIGKRTELIDHAIERFVNRANQLSAVKLKPINTQQSALIQIQKVSKEILGINNAEAYSIQIDTTIRIEAISDIGILYALETLNQLEQRNSIGIQFPKLKIIDWPTYSWRGMMVDVARHFIPMDVMKRNVDAMAAVKYNTLHIHIADDEGFRIESKQYPKLYLNGSNGKYYTQKEMIDFVQYCKERGIEVYAEFDLPGHSQSWFAGYPSLAAEKKNYQPGPRFKIEGDKPVNLMSLMQMMNTTATPTMDVSMEETYQFLDNLSKEMKPLFSKSFMHMGLDENNGVAWKNNPSIEKFMKDKGFESTHELQNYFAERFSKIIEKNGMIPMAWEESFHKGLNKNIVIQVWKPSLMGPTISIDTITNNGNKVIASRGFYLDVFMPAYYHYLNADFIKVNSNNQFLGGEAAIWTELVDEHNFERRVWPRAAVIAERLWSSSTLQDVDGMYTRLNSINDYLDRIGLKHISNNKNQDIKEVLSVITPLKGYKKIMALMTKPTSSQTSTFLQISDTIPVDANAKWIFRADVKKYLQDPSFENANNIKEQLAQWKSLHSKTLSIIELNSIRKHIENLSAISEGVLSYLETRDESLKTKLLQKINASKLPQAETDLAILDEMEAIITGKLKNLDLSVPMF
jgi:hexosaminidase